MAQKGQDIFIPFTIVDHKTTTKFYFFHLSLSLFLFFLSPFSFILFSFLSSSLYRDPRPTPSLPLLILSPLHTENCSCQPLQPSREFHPFSLFLVVNSSTNHHQFRQSANTYEATSCSRHHEFRPNIFGCWIHDT